MKTLVLPDNKPHRLAFYLAMEEFAAHELPSNEYFFAWRVPPTVICGRNQDIEKEVDLAYCNAEGIDVVRRRSGGGCVYADMNNLMFSYITPGSEVVTTFSQYTAMLSAMLRSLGFDAAATGRNDILIGGRKVSGNAFYRLSDRSIVHGTMLYEIDFERMAKAITPSRAKLESKAVKSVQSHITCLKTEGLTMPIEEFCLYAVNYLTDGEPIHLSQEQVTCIEQFEQLYYDVEYINRRRPSGNASLSTKIADVEINSRIDGVGEFSVSIWLDNNHRITEMNLAGDFFVLSNLEESITNKLKGTEFSPESVMTALININTSTVIAGLSNEMFLNLLFNSI